MDRNRIEGSVKKVKGNIEEAAGKLLGDIILVAEGKVDQGGGENPRRHRPLE